MVSADSGLISNPVEARNVAVAAICMAAAAWTDTSMSNERRAAQLMGCLGALSATFPVGEAPTLAAFRRGLQEPLGRLLPPGAQGTGVDDLVLVDAAGELRDAALDLAGEHYVPNAALDLHWPWRRVRVEQQERELYRSLLELGESGYSRARELLVDHPAGELRTLRRTWDDLWPEVGDYRPISNMPWVSVGGWWFACPRCRWPMRAVQGRGASAGQWEVRCEAHALEGVVYTTRTSEWVGDRPLLRPARSETAEVEGQPASPDHLVVSRAVWRYVTLPGVLECRLRDEARRLGGQVTMWPQLDAYDLHIELGGKEWHIDAKDWASSTALIDALREMDRPHGHHLYIVIPDRQRPVREALHQAVAERDMTVLTAKGLMQQMRRSAGQAS